MDKQKLLRRFYVFLVLFSFGAIFLFIQQFLNQKVILSSPLPDFLTFFKNDQVRTLSLWIPVKDYLEVKGSEIKKPEISAKSALVYDLSEEKVLFEKNSSEKLPMASLTKIMTAIIALENFKEDGKFRVIKEDLVGENSMGLAVGEELRFKDLLYGLILMSGNDAGEVLARNFPGGRVSFIEAMNKKAKSLGALNTNFTNPTGLEGDGSQYSTVYDLLVVSKYAMSFDLFRQVVSTVDYYIAETLSHKEFLLYNETNLLTSYPGVKGVKTGYTNEAGLCLVTYLDYRNHEIIGIILGSNSRREEMKELLDYSLIIQDFNPPPHE